MALELPKFTKKEKNPGAGGAKNDITMKVLDFFEKNPAMKIVIPVLLFLLMAAIFLFIMFGDGILLGDGADSGSDATEPSNQVEILPENNVIKDKEVVELIGDDPLSQDILANAAYKGSVKGTSGLKTALIQIGDSTSPDTLVLAVGETIGESDWELVEIADKYVVFKAGELTKTINLS